MVVNVLANIIQIVVFATGTDALLRVDGAFPLGHVAVGVNSAQENGLELERDGKCKRLSEIN